MQVKSCPQDYRIWQQTMYANFGQKWSKLHHGPLWSFTSSSVSDDASHSRILEVSFCAHTDGSVFCMGVGSGVVP